MTSMQAEVSYPMDAYFWIRSARQVQPRQPLPNAGELVPMFKACNLVFKHDVAATRFLLPYIVHNALAHGSDAARESVRAEIEAVLRAGHASREGELCVQEIFSMLDALKKAVAEARAAAPPTPSGVHLCLTKAPSH